MRRHPCGYRLSPMNPPYRLLRGRTAPRPAPPPARPLSAGGVAARPPARCRAGRPARRAPPPATAAAAPSPAYGTGVRAGLGASVDGRQHDAVAEAVDERERERQPAGHLVERVIAIERHVADGPAVHRAVGGPPVEGVQAHPHGTAGGAQRDQADGHAGHSRQHSHYLHNGNQHGTERNVLVNSPQRERRQRPAAGAATSRGARPGRSRRARRRSARSCPRPG